MLLDELAYQAGRQPVVVPFNAQVTVIGGLSRRARQRFTERILGALLGTRPGDGVTLIYRDGSGERVRFHRDEHGAAHVTYVATGLELPYGAAHLPLDGRLDWFATLGLDAAAAGALMVLEPGAFEMRDSFDADEIEDELSDARALLAACERRYADAIAQLDEVHGLRRVLAGLDARIRGIEEGRARRRHGEAALTVHRLERELAVLTGSAPSEEEALGSALGAVRAGDAWRRAAARLDEARRAFGGRTRLASGRLPQAGSRPTAPPPGLAAFHADYVAATAQRNDLLARLGEVLTSKHGDPSAPWVIALAVHADLAAVWAAADRVRDTDRLAAALVADRTGDLPDTLVRDLEAIHDEVAAAEDVVRTARIPGLALRARRRLSRLQHTEHAALARAGLESWAAFRQRRDDTRSRDDDADAREEVRVAVRLARDVWFDVVRHVDAVLDPYAALAARPEIDRYAAEARTGAAAALRRELTDEADPVYAETRAVLLDACGSVQVDPDDAVRQVAALVDEGRHADLQRALEAAELAYRSASRRLDAVLTAAGAPPGTGREAGGGNGAGPYPDRDTDDLSARLALVAARAAEAARAAPPASRSLSRTVETVDAELSWARAALAVLSRPEWDDDPVVDDEPLADAEAVTAERNRVFTRLEKRQRNLPDLGVMEEHLVALRHRVAVLEASITGGYRPLPVGQAEKVLLRRLAATRRVGPAAEPVPLVIDDAFADLAPTDKRRLLDVLVRRRQTSQVVYLTADRETLDWAASRARSGSVAVAVADGSNPSAAGRASLPSS